MKKIKTIIAVIALAVTTAIIPQNLTVTAESRTAITEGEEPVLIGKQSIKKGDISYLVENYSDESIIIQVQCLSSISNSEFVSNVYFPIGMYSFNLVEDRNNFYWDTIEEITEVSDSVFSKYITTHNNTNLVSATGTGKVVAFELTPLSNQSSADMVWLDGTKLQRSTNIADIEKYEDPRIEQYQQEIENLKATVQEMKNTWFRPDDIKRFDWNNDGLIDSVDSSINLSYYAYASTGKYFDTLSEFLEYLYSEAEN